MYFLKQKLKVSENFKKFKGTVKKKVDTRLKPYEANRIRCPLTVPRSPQQNGVVEKKEQNHSRHGKKHAQ